MKKMKVIIFLIISSALFNYSYSQTDISKLIADFTSDDWKTVEKAKTALENLESKAIEQVLPLLDRDEVVKLKNTGSLIYPGAEKFFGHGQIVDYDIDNISVRAGWLIEDLSFNNFGFTGIHLPDDELKAFIKTTFSEYYNNSTNRRKIESSSAAELRNLIHKQGVKEAKAWWNANKNSWTRLEALVEGLLSFDERRQVKALFYMRNGKTKCSGLTRDYYIDNISREIVRLSSSETKRISEHARFILFDTQFLWLEGKN